MNLMKPVYLFVLILSLLFLAACGNAANNPDGSSQMPVSDEGTAQASISTDETALSDTTDYTEAAASAAATYRDTLQKINWDDRSVAATVNGQAILQTDVAAKRALAEFSANMERYSLSLLSGAEREAYAAQLPAYVEDPSALTDEYVLHILIRNAVVLQAAEQAGFSVPEEDLYAQAKQEMSLASSDAFLSAALDGYGLDEEGYIQSVSIPNIRQRSANLYLKNKFFEGKSEEERTEANYDAYIDSLVARAQIHP